MQNDHYRFVINDLQSRWDRRIDELKASDPELKSIAQAIDGLRALVQPAHTSAFQPNHKATEASAPYAGISVRWAILYLLAEHVSRPMPTGKIAKMLSDGGITTKGANFSANVSAVLSNMVHERQEVRSAEEGYELTEVGRAAWMGIKASPQMQLRLEASA